MSARENKAAYVLRQKQTRYHTCHWPECAAQVPPAMWGCKPHWFKLPKELRDKIWRVYRPGQENDMNPSPEYLKIAEEVQGWILELSGNSGGSMTSAREKDERRIYNRWGGNPNGTKEDVTCCIAEVYSMHLFYQCSRKRGKGPDGLFCGLHASHLARGNHVYLCQGDEHLRGKQ